MDHFVSSKSTVAANLKRHMYATTYITPYTYDMCSRRTYMHMSLPTSGRVMTLVQQRKANNCVYATKENTYKLGWQSLLLQMVTIS